MIYYGKKVQLSKDFRSDGVRISKMYNYFYKKKLLKVPPCVAITNVKWMKEFFFKTVCRYPKWIYIIHSYLSVLKLQNYYWQCSSCAFFRKIEEKLFCVIEPINEISATTSLMNICHTLCKRICSIFYSSGSIQIKSCWLHPTLPPLSNKLSWQKPQYPEG